MKRFIEGVDRDQSALFPERLDEFVGDDNPVRVIDVFVDELDLGGLGFDRVDRKATGRPGYHPSVLLKLYVYGYLNRVQSSRRLEREAGRAGSESRTLSTWPMRTSISAPLASAWSASARAMRES